MDRPALDDFVTFKPDPDNGAGLWAVFLGSRALHHFRPDQNVSQYMADVRDNLETFNRTLSEKWIEAIQGALGNMGRIGDRDYFTFCMWLVFKQAAVDGLIPYDARYDAELERLGPKIARMKETLTKAHLIPQSP
jgi:hypothetical protein